MEQNEQSEWQKVDLARAALSCNANLIVTYNHKKLMWYYEDLQHLTEKHPDEIFNLVTFCTIVYENGVPCKKEGTKNSFSFVARGISKDEALAEY